MKNYAFNFTVNLIDGAFFGLAMGFASYTSVLPLFVRQMSDSALMIGLITGMHFVGWQLPQLFTARLVSRQRRFKPLVILITVNERLPFLPLALVAWLAPRLGAQVTLLLAFVILLWQGLGGGLTANPWQNMIAKIMTPQRTGLFYGMQAALFSIFFAGGAVISGIFLERYQFPNNFALCFLAAGIAMLISLIFISLTRESENELPPPEVHAQAFWGNVARIILKDANFRAFILVRALFQFAVMAFSFYVVFGVEQFGMSKILAGQVTGIVAILTTVANPILGWFGDRWGHRKVVVIGALAAALSAGIAFLAPSLGWLYFAFLLTAIPGVVAYTSIMSMTLEFGSEADRPAYVGLANTLVAPATILAPLFGGWLADQAGFQAAFALSAVFGLGAVLFSGLLKEPRHISRAAKEAA